MCFVVMCSFSESYKATKNNKIMKTQAILIFKTLLTVFFFASISVQAQDQVQVEPDMTIKASSETYELVKTWADEFSKRNPGNEITVIRTENASVPDSEIMGHITTNLPDSQNEYWTTRICSEIIVPVINQSHPALSQYQKSGITKADLAGMYSTTEPVWPGTQEEIRAKILLLQENKVNEHLTRFLGQDVPASKHHTFSNSGDLLKELRSDNRSLAFLPLKDVIDEEKSQLKESLSFLPIDRNANGRLDHMENIYGSLDQFSRGAQIGKFPQELCCDVYLLTNEKPDKSREKAFITFLLTQGKSNISGFGFSNLAYSTRQAELQKLNEITVKPTGEEEAGGSWITIALIIAAIIIGTGFIMNLIFGFTKNGVADNTEDNLNYEPQGAIDESTIAAPEGLFFDKSHTWTYLEKDGKVRMGMDDFMQQVTGPITRIKFRKSGDHVRKGEPIVTIIQNGKQLSLNAPVSGTIDTINESLKDNSSSVNSAPFNEGWLYLIAPDNWQQETPFLKMATEYRTWMQGEIARLKDFLAYSLNIHNTNLAHVALQDGGAVKKHVLKDLPPEAWEDFQSNFLERIK